MICLKRKLAVIISLIALTAAFTGCGGEGNVTSQRNTSTTTTTAAPTETTSRSETETTPVTEQSETTTSGKTAQMMEGENEETTPTDTTTTETSPIITDGDTITEDSTLPVLSENGEKIAQTAELLLDIPFVEGGASPDAGFDSSGFIYYVMKASGFDGFARGLNAQISEAAQTVGYDELQRGDAVYFTTAEDHSRAQFGGVYIGDGKMIFSSTNGTSTAIKDISSEYWRGCFVAGVRA